MLHGFRIHHPPTAIVRSGWVPTKADNGSAQAPTGAAPSCSSGSGPARADTQMTGPRRYSLNRRFTHIFHLVLFAAGLNNNFAQTATMDSQGG